MRPSKLALILAVAVCCSSYAHPHPRKASLARLLDQNANGLSYFDLRNRPAATRRIFARFDRNDDQKLQLREIRRIREPIHLADCNRDGELTRQEVMDWLRRWANHLGDPNR